MFRYETHMHTCQGSACGVSTGAEHARFYKERGYQGIFVTDHFFGGNPAVPRFLSWEERIEQFLKGLLEHMDVDAAPEISITEEGNYKVVLQGQGLGAIIGRRGETLDAIQQLTNYTVNHNQSKRVRIHIDAENYRAKREESLQRLAVKVAGKVVKYRKNVTLEAMNAYERHVIHTALQDYRGVTTYSTGTEPNRRTVVAYDATKR